MLLRNYHCLLYNSPEEYSSAHILFECSVKCNIMQDITKEHKWQGLIYQDGKRCTLWSSVLYRSRWIDKFQHFGGILDFNVQGIRHTYQTNITITWTTDMNRYLTVQFLITFPFKISNQYYTLHASLTKLHIVLQWICSYIYYLKRAMKWTKTLVDAIFNCTGNCHFS
jgi:hypothetical protein